MKKCIILVLCILLLLCGCKGSPSTPQKPAQKETEGPAVSAEILQRCLLDTLAAEDKDGEPVPGYLLQMDEKRTVEVLSFQHKGQDHLEVKVAVAAPDLYHVIKTLETETFSTETEMDEALTAGIQAAELVRKELILNFYLDEEWEPSLTEEFMDACYGGILTLRQEYYEAMTEVE